jgi:hypothetical protein
MPCTLYHGSRVLLLCALCLKNGHNSYALSIVTFCSFGISIAIVDKRTEEL